MKSTQSSGTDPDHQMVAGTWAFKSNGPAITIGFADQQHFRHSGSVLFWGWLRLLGWCQRLAAVQPQKRPPHSNNMSEKYNCEVGRIRLDCALDNGLCFWVSGDQLLKGAALNAVQIAEELLK